MAKINNQFYLEFILLLISWDAYYLPHTKTTGSINTFDVKYLNTEINKVNTKLLLENSLVYSDFGFVELVYTDDIPYRESPFNSSKNYSKKEIPFLKYGKYSTF